MDNDFKFCLDCNKSKPLKDFFKSYSQNIIKYTTRCKPCHNKWCREYRKTDKHKKVYKKWAKSDRGKEVIKNRNTNWHKKNKQKHDAQTASYNAIRDKRLIPQKCIICNSPKVEAHHPDYCKPFKVIWLCRSHHTTLHYPNRLS